MYTSDVALHEWLLRSPHRVADGRDADYFYVPLYLSCLMNPVYDYTGADPNPNPHPHPHPSVRRNPLRNPNPNPTTTQARRRTRRKATRASRPAPCTRAAWPCPRWSSCAPSFRTGTRVAAPTTSSSSPTTRARAGNPHPHPHPHPKPNPKPNPNLTLPLPLPLPLTLTLLRAPHEIARKAILLTHWGRMDVNKDSSSRYPQDNWKWPVEYSVRAPWGERWDFAREVAQASRRGAAQRGSLALIGEHKCYDPAKVG